MCVCVLCIADCRESLSHAAACVNLRALDIGANQIELFSELLFLQPLEHLEALTLEVRVSNGSILGQCDIVTRSATTLAFADRRCALYMFRATLSHSMRRIAERCSLCFHNSRAWMAAK